jgi:hypothetical protein
VATQQTDTDTTTNVNESSAERPRAPTYFMLMRQSKKLGEIATRTFTEAKQKLNQDVVFPRAERFIETITQPFNKTEVEHVPTIDTIDVTKLKKLIQHSSEIIATVQTVFPITLFPHSIILDRTKITIKKQDSPWSAKVISIRIEDVLNVSSNLGLVFGSISIASRVMNSVDHFEIAGLWRRDAIELQHLIQGYTIAKNSGVSTDHLSINELVNVLHDLGRAT